jgi:hypothetical protein
VVHFDTLKKVKVIKTIKKSNIGSFSIHNDGDAVDEKSFDHDEGAMSSL